MSAVEKWTKDLASWGIPEEILNQATESPWIHPPKLFTVPAQIATSPSHEIACEVLPLGGSVLDIGCGGGVAAFACADIAAEVIGVDHQSEMLQMFADRAEAEKLAHQEILGDWPDVANKTPIADLVTCHHVVYNISNIEPFLLELDAHAEKRVVIEMPAQHPLSNLNLAWKHFWNLERPVRPTPEDLILVLKELGITANIKYWENPNFRDIDFDSNVEFTRIRLCLSKDRSVEVREFMLANQDSNPRKIATIWWDKI